MGPEISVVVPSHDRPLRLRWLLNALETELLEREHCEIVVAHDSAGDETDALLRTHPLASSGHLRAVRRPPGSAPPGANRNAGWRNARAPVIAFIDDDCRPAPGWVRGALAAARAVPGAVIQGATVADPDERTLLNARFVHTQHIAPPQPFAQACNIVYPRDVLEALGGFDEALLTGEDMDLAARARAAGVRYVGAPGLLAWHAVVPLSTLRQLRSTGRWADLPAVLHRHPRLRRHFPLGLFWRRSHPRALGLLIGAGGTAARRPAVAALALPFVRHELTRHGMRPRRVLRALIEAPARLITDLAEVIALARGSLRHRTLFL